MHLTLSLHRVCVLASRRGLHQENIYFFFVFLKSCIEKHKAAWVTEKVETRAATKKKHFNCVANSPVAPSEMHPGCGKVMWRKTEIAQWNQRERLVSNTEVFQLFLFLI